MQSSKYFEQILFIMIGTFSKVGTVKLITFIFPHWLRATVIYIYIYYIYYIYIYIYIYHRHLKLRTEGRLSWVRELGSIQFFNVTSTYVPFLAKFRTHNRTRTRNKGREIGNDMIWL